MASDLSSYAQKRAPGEIRQDILNPRPAGRAGPVTVTTRDGSKFFGMARNEDNFSLQLQTPDGAFHLFLKSDVTSIAPGSTALMPSDYASTLGAEELNDLVAFLIATTGGKGPHVAKKVFKEDEENE